MALMGSVIDKKSAIGVVQGLGAPPSKAEIVSSNLAGSSTHVQDQEQVKVELFGKMWLTLLAPSRSWRPATTHLAARILYETSGRRTEPLHARPPG